MKITDLPQTDDDSAVISIRRPQSAMVWLRRTLLLLLLGLVGAAAYYYYFGRTTVAQPPASRPWANAGGRGAPAPVAAVPAKSADIGVELSGLGTVTPVNSVAVKSRVDGQLMKVLFSEGQSVKAGDLLAEIDPRPYQVQLTQAQGQMARDQALLKNAQTDLERYRTLFQQDSIAKQQLDTQASLVRQYEAALKTDQGQIDNAKLQLVYCRITAPIGGRLGLRQVDPGNIVHAADTSGLVVITQLQPIAVIFTIPQDNLPAVMKKLTAGDKLSVEAYDRDAKNKLAAGTLLTVDNQIDPTTGTVKLKAQFPNDDYGLFPNQFVNVRLLLDVKREATVIPTVAIQRGAQGTFVYVLKSDNTVTVRPIALGPTQGENAAVDKGLAPGDMVVVDGTDKLRDGAKVELGGADSPVQQDAKPHKDGDKPTGQGWRKRRGDASAPAASQ
jgi:membrane fusion protein, multidrug efflux system